MKLIKVLLAEGMYANDLFSFVMDVVDPETGEKIGLREWWEEAASLFPAGKG